MNFKKSIYNFFQFNNKSDYEFILPNSSNNIDEQDNQQNAELVSPNIKSNLEFLKSKYNLLINSDIKTRKFKINISNKFYNAFLIYIDGMIDEDSVTSSIMQPLLINNSFSNIKQSRQIE